MKQSINVSSNCCGEESVAKKSENQSCGGQTAIGKSMQWCLKDAGVGDYTSAGGGLSCLLVVKDLGAGL